jgi:hypothetical protein
VNEWLKLRGLSISARRRIVTVVLLVCCFYVVSFFVIRKWIVWDISLIDSHENGRHVLLYYFSNDQAINTALFYTYLPLRATHGIDESALLLDKHGHGVNRETAVYVNNLDIIRRIGGIVP